MSLTMESEIVYYYCISFFLSYLSNTLQWFDLEQTALEEGESARKFQTKKSKLKRVMPLGQLPLYI